MTTPMLFLMFAWAFFFKIADINNSSPHCKGDKIDQNGQTIKYKLSDVKI